MSEKTIVKMLFGSHLYGLNNENSDMDYKGIILPSKEQILMGNGNFSISESTGDNNSKNGADDTDIEMFSLQRFIELAMKGETVAIDMLHAPKSAIIESSDIWDWLVRHREMFYTKNMKAYVGYVRKQAAKYGVKGSRLGILEQVMNYVKDIEDITTIEMSHLIATKHVRLDSIIEKLPVSEYSSIVNDTTPQGDNQTFYELLGRKYQSTLKLSDFKMQLDKLYASYGARAQAAKNNEGIDWKAVSHALRAGYQAKYIYTKGGFTYPLPETRYLKDVKEGKLDYVSNVQLELEMLVDNVLVLAENSEYPDKVNPKQFNKFIMEIHELIVTNRER